MAIVLFLAIPAQAQDGRLEPGGRCGVSEALLPLIGLFEDASATLDIEAVLLPATQSLFRELQAGANPQFGFTRSAYWVKLELRNSCAVPIRRLLELANPLTSDVRLYRSDDHGEMRVIATGRAFPFSSRPYPNRMFVFPLELEPRSSMTVYLRIASVNALGLPLKVWEPEAFHRAERDDYIAQAWYFGTATAMVLFNLLLLIALRDSIYLNYVVFISTGVLALAAQNGHAQEFLMPGARRLADVIHYIGFSIALASLLMFMRQMLDTARTLPAVDRVIRLVVGLHLVLGALVALSERAYAQLSNVFYLLTVLLIVGVCGMSAAQRQRGAYYFIAAFAALMAGVVLTVLRNFGVLPANVLTNSALQVGSLFEMLLLALALADRFNVMRRQQANAQHAALDAERRTVASLQDSERVLEGRVARRTELLAESQQKLQGIVDTALDGVVRVDANGCIVDWNRQAEALFGWRADEAIGMNLDETIIPRIHRAAHRAGMQRFMASGVSRVVDRRIEITALHRDGHEFPIELAITRVALRNTSLFEFCAFIRDISERKKAEEDIRTALEKQRELNDLKSRFVSMTSHEFRTPLATILSSTELIRHYGERLPAEERLDLFESIEHAVRRMTKMLDDILTIGRTDAGAIVFDPAPHAPLQLIADVACETGRAVAGRRDSPDRLQIESDLVGTELMLDAVLLRHVISNLVSNAFKYSPGGGAIFLRLTQRNGQLLIEVEDSGIGIPHDDQARLFETFHRAGNVANISGTGLGMAIVKRAVDLHGGRIDVRSEPGQGSCFSVSLPAIAANTSISADI